MAFLLCRLVKKKEKEKKILERALRLLHNDSYFSYNSLLLKAEMPTLEVSRLRRLAIEVFKTLKIVKSRLHAHIAYISRKVHTLLGEKIT